LDVGCGFGHLAKHFIHCDYTGIDIDAERITVADRFIGGHDRRRFIVGDVCHMNLPSKGFDKAIGYGILHHLSDHDASRLLSELARLVRGKIVFSDPVYSQYHLVNNLLCRLDQGRYVRSAEEYLRLCRRYLRIQEHRFFYARNGLAKYLLITCMPS
jgi:SAM-dependent methyltransferase